MNLFRKKKKVLEVTNCKCGCDAGVYKSSGLFGKYRCGCMDSDCAYSTLWRGEEHRRVEDAVKAWNEDITR